jgi:HEAT repeat protein
VEAEKSVFSTFNSMKLLVFGVFGMSAVIGCVQPNVPNNLGSLEDRARTGLHRAMRYPDNPVVRVQAMEAAGDILGQEAILRIREGLHDENAGVRFAACMALGELKDRKSLPEIRKLVHDENDNVRVAAFYALERMGIHNHRREWQKILYRHEDAEVRRNAVLALGRLKDPATKPLLRKVAARDNDMGVKLQAYEALALMGDKDAIDQFLFHAYGAQGYKLPFALLTLGKIDDPRMVDALRIRLENAPYLEAKLAAARSLGMHGLDDGFQLCLETLHWNQPEENLQDDPPHNQIMRKRSMAATALGDIGRPGALGPLKERMINSPDPRVQLACAAAILKILKDMPATGESYQ